MGANVRTVLSDVYLTVYTSILSRNGAFQMNLTDSNYLLVQESTAFSRMLIYFAGVRTVGERVKVLWTPVRHLAALIPTMELATAWTVILKDDHGVNVLAEPVSPRPLPAYRMPVRKHADAPRVELRTRSTASEPVLAGAAQTWMWRKAA